MQHLRIIFYTFFYTILFIFYTSYFILFLHYFILQIKIINGGIMDEPLNLSLDDLLKKEKEPEPSKKETKEGSSIDVNKVLELLNKFLEVKTRGGMQPQQPAPQPAQVQEGQGLKGEVIYNYFVEALQGFKLMGIETIDDALVYCDKNKEEIIKVIEGGMNGV